MTIVNACIGSDRAMLLADSGQFERTPPHRLTGTRSKILALPEWRMLSAGCGSSVVTSQWRQWLACGGVGSNLADIATHGPTLLRELWGASANPCTVIFVVALGDDGRPSAVAMGSGDGFQPYRIPRGHVLLLPPTAELPAERSEDSAEPADAPPVETRAQAEPAVTTPADDDRPDWLYLRRKLIHGTRLQLEQRRVQFAAPFTLATLHPEGIDLRRFEP